MVQLEENMRNMRGMGATTEACKKGRQLRRNCLGFLLPLLLKTCCRPHCSWTRFGSSFRFIGLVTKKD
ncbi:hypothetical protein E1A91_D01G177600v1 [Gossypium mustelinum]|uniref:Uncharacterized protein n=1 Tax=Gossypium mustelinum TaxID=34275 RepID=A0A5D2W8Q7_GOSMU|nr:hypothetical protein E1A91_D01G177600v1 [Gossypium mustelinum]